MPFLYLTVGEGAVRVALCLIMILICMDADAEVPNRRWEIAPIKDLPAVDLASEWASRELIGRRGSIRLGIAVGDYEPLLVVQGNKVKGVAVDYLGIIGKSLGLPLEVKFYPGISAALEGLRSGAVDVLASGSGYEAALSGVALSRPYIINQPVLVAHERNIKEGTSPARSGVALVNGYLSTADFAQRYPEASTTIYASVKDALHDVEYRRQEWMIGDAATVAYQFSLGEVPHLRMQFIEGWKPQGYSFVFRDTDAELRGLFDLVLQRIPSLIQTKIFNFWGISARFLSSQDDYHFTMEELRWLNSSPAIRVAVNGANPPYTFYDADGGFQGILPDLLKELSKRTGLNFSMVECGSSECVWESLENGRSDMASVFTADSRQNESLNVTQPYAHSSHVVVVPEGSAVSDLAQLNDGRVVVLKESAAAEFLERNYPRLQRVEVDTVLDGLMAVAKREASAAVLLFPVANYYVRRYFSGGLKFSSASSYYSSGGKNSSLVWFPVARYYYDRYLTDGLKVSFSVPQVQLAHKFFVSRRNQYLFDVLQKTLDQIEPSYVNDLSDRWQAESVSGEIATAEYFNLMRWGRTFSAFLIFLFLACFIVLFWRGNKRRAEASLHELRSHLLDGIPQGIVVRDPSGRIVICNQAFYQTFELQPGQVIGKLPSEVGGGDAKIRQILGGDYFELIQKGEMAISEVSTKLRDSEVVMRRWVVPYSDSRGCVVGLVMGWMDITSSVLLTRQLQVAKDQAVQANEAKSRFLAVMSHEIRTPLNAIIGLLELVMQRVDRGEEWDRGAVEVAYSSSNELLLVIGEILDLAKIESGKLEIEPHPCNLSFVLSSVVRVFEGVARQKGIYLKSAVVLKHDVNVFLDAGRFKQVIYNILSNAIKFTERGGVEVILDGAEDGDGYLLVSMRVEDTGCGISLEDQARLFQPFSQGKNLGSRQEGTGLGLFICREVIELMGGRLHLESAMGVGSRIDVELRVPISKELQVDQFQPPRIDVLDLQMRRILIVDDHLPNRLLLRQQLEFLGHQVSEAENGKQALLMAQAEDYNVIITDCSMPVMDGYAFTEAWRTWEQDKGRTPIRIIGFTANAQLQEYQRCRDVGMDDCLFKPVRLDMLRICLSQHCDSVPMQAVESSLAQQGADVFDWEMLDTLIGNDRNVLRILFKELHRSNEIDLRVLDEGIAIRGWREQRSLVHRVKGAARMVGATILIEAAMAYEAAWESGEPNEALEAACLKVRDALALIQEEIEKRIFETEGL